MYAIFVDNGEHRGLVDWMLAAFTVPGPLHTEVCANLIENFGHSAVMIKWLNDPEHLRDMARDLENKLNGRS